MWFSVVCSLIDNDMRHHSGQNVVDSQGTAKWVHSKMFFAEKGIAWHIDASSSLHSYHKQQIGQSDCEISNCGKKCHCYVIAISLYTLAT